MFTNEEAYLMKTIIEALQANGADTSAIEKALGIVLSYDSLPVEKKDEITNRLPK